MQYQRCDRTSLASIGFRRWSYAVVLLCCSVSMGQDADRNSKQWTFQDAGKAGLDVKRLAKLTADIKQGDTNTHAILIEHDGSLVYEEYFEGTDERHSRPLGKRLLDSNGLHDLRSVTKSVTSLLLGIALKKTNPKVDFESAVQKSISEYLPKVSLDTPQQQINLHHLLTMTPGLKWNEFGRSYRDGSNDAVRLYGLSNPTKFVLSRPVVSRPGTKWNYNGGCTYVIADVITELTGQTIDVFAKEELFKPLGISKYEWYRSEQWKTGNPSAAAGLRLTARDLAKMGSLVLHQGKWRDQQIVPAKWVELSTIRHASDIGRMGGNGIWGYGYHWKVGKLPSGEKAIAAVGNGNQRVFVVPEMQIVVTVFAGRYNLPFKPHSELIMKQVLNAFN